MTLQMVSFRVKVWVTLLSNYELFDNTGSIKSKSVTKIVRKSNFIEQITYFTYK